jgi:pilus assembly protein CpaE
MAINLLVASSDESFREMVRENLLNLPNAKVVSEYPEVSFNLYIRVLQDLERYQDAALIFDMSADPSGAVKALEKVKQAAPELYVMASDYSTDGESVIAVIRAGASDYLVQPVKRVEFRDAIARLEHMPRRAGGAGMSRLGKVYTFLGTKGGVGATSLAVNFASVLAQRKQQVVMIDLDWNDNDVAMQLGAQPQYTLVEVGENLGRMDQTLFEGFVTRDPLGFFLVGPPDSLDTPRSFFSDHMLREFITFLVEKYESIVIDAGGLINDEVVMSALQSSSNIFLVITQDFPSIRNAQRYISYLMRMGFNQDQIRLVVNKYTKKVGPQRASLEQIQQTLNQSVFYGVAESPAVLASINKARPLVSDRQAYPEMDRVYRAFADKVTGAKSALGKTA